MDALQLELVQRYLPLKIICYRYVRIGLAGPNCLKLTAPEFHLVAIKEILLAEFVICR